jgi:hypothetical protein
VLEPSLVVEEAEEERTDRFALAVLVPAESREDHVDASLMLDLEHHAFSRLYVPLAGFAMTPSSPAPSKRSNQSATTARSRVMGVR